jgi:predicted glycoside hydrolase/deacetylase ChbG (UPF0249 family)
MTARRVIVTADDFGLTAGVTRGIVRAHVEGIVTATSLMVDEPGAADAARATRELPSLDIGLHVVAPDDGSGWAAALERQLARFVELLGRPPTHLDSHHDVHHVPDALPHFARTARALGVPLRGHGPARQFSRFYGRWDGESHPEHISADNLLALVDEHATGGWTELNCHPGEVDGDLRSGYAAEREIELETLCAPALRSRLQERGIGLAGFRDLPAGA